MDKNDLSFSDLLLARGRDRLETTPTKTLVTTELLEGLLLARGRDRLETASENSRMQMHLCLLLARGRDRLETKSVKIVNVKGFNISYSLGDAIDWKQA